MFKDAYIKDNEIIRPDDEFLEQLKKKVAQERNKIDVRLSENGELDGMNYMKVTNNKDSSFVGKLLWKRVVAIAACFALMCMAVYVANVGDILDEYKMTTHLQDIFLDEKAKDETKDEEIDTETKHKWDALYKLFQTSNAVIYNVGNTIPSDVSMVYIDTLRDSQCEMKSKERDNLVADILNQRYEILESIESFEDVYCYVAKFENDCFVVFAVKADKYIYIDVVSDAKILTCLDYIK